jgi:hypothetical protein
MRYGLDIHKRTVAACLITPGPIRKPMTGMHRFGTVTDEPLHLAGRLVAWPPRSESATRRLSPRSSLAARGDAGAKGIGAAVADAGPGIDRDPGWAGEAAR